MPKPQHAPHLLHSPHLLCMCLRAPFLIIRESLAHIPRFSLSVAVLWVEYIPRTQVLLQSFPHSHFCLFIPVAQPHPSVGRRCTAPTCMYQLTTFVHTEPLPVALLLLVIVKHHSSLFNTKVEKVYPNIK